MNKKERCKLLGECRECDNKATHGVYCTSHREKYNKISKEIRQCRKENGVCLGCGGETCPESTAYCVLHFHQIKKALEKPDTSVSGALAKVMGVNKFDKKKLNDIKDLLRVYTEHSDLILNDRQAAILELRVLSHYPMTLADLGDVFGGITRERVRQIEAQLSSKLFHFITVKNYLEDLRNNVNQNS